MNERWEAGSHYSAIFRASNFNITAELSNTQLEEYTFQ